MNILVLTSKYPDEKPVKGFTPVVHYFTKEWVKQGHTVKVIHSQSKFPFFLYWVPKFIVRKLESKLGFTFPNKAMNTEKEYNNEGVIVKRYMLFRATPFTNYYPRTLKSLINVIVKANQKEQFKPDFIVAHFLNPQVILLAELKKIYNCKTSLVLHSVKKDIDAYKIYLEEVDVFGFRSLSIKDRFLKKFPNNNYFMCYSGIDENEIVEYKIKPQGDLNSFIFVGMLIKRKYPDVLLRALSELPYKSFKCTIIGDGPEKSNLNDLILEKNILNNVSLKGHVKREQVMKELEQHDCFIMISEKEVFGLVYIEAMAKGCIVIASRNEGMQGIIQNGKNGFLCEAGNKEELLSILTKINQLSDHSKSVISLNAINTAKKYSENNVSIHYLNNVLKIY